ncbi:MAG: cell division protein SepF [Clostridiales bacterium]|nr:cell division protein SepF [Clostridiales bacterium]
MGILDKFLNFMSLEDDEDDYDEDFIDDEEYYEEKPKKSFFKKDKSPKYDEDDAFEDEPPKKSSKFSSKVTPIKQNERSSARRPEIRFIKPTSVDDSREVSETLISNRAVMLNLEGLDIDVAQRIIDFTSGSCFALRGNLRKVTQFVFVLTPSTFEVSGDLTDLLDTDKSSLDVSSVRSSF